MTREEGGRGWAGRSQLPDWPGWWSCSEDLCPELLPWGWLLGLQGGAVSDPGCPSGRFWLQLCCHIYTSWSGHDDKPLVTSYRPKPLTQEGPMVGGSWHRSLDVYRVQACRGSMGSQEPKLCSQSGGSPGAEDMDRPQTVSSPGSPAQTGGVGIPATG